MKFKHAGIITSLLGQLLNVTAQYDPHFTTGHGGIIHLFEWHWSTIADECENILAPNKVGGVQTSPVNENRVVTEENMEDATVDRPWWERYQPVSYELETRSGTREEFIDMVQRCNAVGVRIYVDIVVNHMVGYDASTTCTGTAGNTCNADVAVESFPAVPYDNTNFNDYRCDSSNGKINNYGDPSEVRNCQLVGLLDLDQSNADTAGKIVNFLNDLLSIGVAGFRVDAMKHMWPEEVNDNILKQLNDVDNEVFGAGKKAWIGSEVIDQGGEPITASEYFNLGTVTEFNYCFGVGNLIGEISALVDLDKDGKNWGFIPSPASFVFINNHDNQRGHGGGGNVVTFKNPYELKLATAFMLTHPYGHVKRVMSSYYFANNDQGPPPNQPSWDTECSNNPDNGWVCEHRWPTILALFQLNGAVDPSWDRYNWWDNWGNQVAYSRGSDENTSASFVAINGEGKTLQKMGGNFTTGLPSGDYQDLISGEIYGIGPDGNVRFCLEPLEDQNVLAFTLASKIGAFSGMNEIDPNCDNSGMEDNPCIDCTCPARQRQDCGTLTTGQADCEKAGCLWCPLEEGSKAPWCFIPGEDYVPPTTPTPGPTLYPPTTTEPRDPSQCENVRPKYECGYYGIKQTECEDHDHDCCWQESSNGDPWCFHDSSWKPVKPDDETCSPSIKNECGYMGITGSECNERGCCWKEGSGSDPWCFYPER